MNKDAVEQAFNKEFGEAFFDPSDVARRVFRAGWEAAKKEQKCDHWLCPNRLARRKFDEESG